MIDWLEHILNPNQTGYTLLLAVFILGIVSVFTCVCNFSIYGIIGSYAGAIGLSYKRKRTWLKALFFLVGIIFSMTLIGGIIGFTGELLNQSLGIYWKVAAGIILILFGLNTLDLLPFKFNNFNLNLQKESYDIRTSFLFGMSIGGLGLINTSCCSPIFPIILGVSFVKSSFIWGLIIVFFYALGYGITISIISIFIAMGVSKVSTKLTRLGSLLKYCLGALMLIVGFYLLWTF